MAHSNTILLQLLQLINKHDFKRIENNGFKPKRKYRSFNRWDQFVTMFFAQISGRDSLRNIVEHFKFQSRKLYHLGINMVKRSTLSDANKNRSADFFQSLFEHQYLKLKAILPDKKKFKFKNNLYLLDSTTIDLCLTLFPWAKFRKTKAGVKMHTLLDHQGDIPCFVKITSANISDIRIAKTLNLCPDSIVTMDRGYVDYKWFDKLTKRKIFFVSRLKSNAGYRMIRRNKCLKSKGITSDQIVEFTGTKFKKDKITLRRIGYRDPGTGKHYKFITNNFNLSAKTIADIYKERWQIELFFKWIKQNLKIKSFLGNSKNAILTQIWTALIVMLLLMFLKIKAKLGNSLSKLLQLMQLNLFEKRSIWMLYEKEKPDINKGNKQLSFNFKWL